MKPDIDKIEREADRIGNQAGGFATRHPRWMAVIMLAVVIVVAVLALKACTAKAASLTLDCPGGTFTMTAGTVTCNVTAPPGGGGTTPPTVPPGCSVLPMTSSMRVLFPADYAIKFTAANDEQIHKFKTAAYGGGGEWTYSLSTKPCDYANAVPLISSLPPGNLQPGKVTSGTSDNGNITVAYKAGKNVTAGQAYFFNLYGPRGGLAISTP